jgi:PAS domain S-box-containing protein
MACVRILIADDHELVRQGLRALLAARPAWQVCGEAADGLEAVEKAARLQPDIVLLDVSMPRLSGLEAAAAIRRKSPASEILIVSQHDPAEMLPRALKVGARGFVSKSDIARNLLATIDSIVRPASRPAATHATRPQAARPRSSSRRRSLPRGDERPAALSGRPDAKHQRADSLLLEQNHLLEMIARGRPLDDCLRAISESVGHLQPGVRAGVTLVDSSRRCIERVVSSQLPQQLTAGLRELSIADRARPVPCTAALLDGATVTVADVTADTRWPASWRQLYASHGVRAFHSTPVWNAEGAAVAAFFVCLGEAREPNAWERDLAQFGAHLGSLAIERWRAETALRESEQKFRTLFESIDEGFCVLEKVPGAPGAPLDFCFLQANPGFEAHTGVADVVGRTLREAFPEESQDLFLTYAGILASGESRKFERGQLAHGRVLDLYAFRVADGSHSRVAVIVKDITERKRAEAFMLCQKDAFEKAASGMALIEVLEFLAQRLEQHLGGHPRVAIHLLNAAGQRFARTAAPNLPAEYGEWLARAPLDSPAHACCVAVTRGERLSIADAPASEEFPAYAAFAARHGIRSGWVLPIFSSKGRPLGAIACHYDDSRQPHVRDDLLSGILMRTASVIIERKQVEEMLRQRSAQFEILVDQAPIGVFLLDGDLRIRQVNPVARPTFAPVSDLVGRDLCELMHELLEKEFADELMRVFRHTLATGESHHATEQARPRRERGSSEFYDWRVERIPLPEGGHGVVCYFRDVSVEMQARTALQEARDHLESRVRERTDELEKAYKSLRVLSMRMMQMQDEDRRRIARDLHDSAGQLLAALGMELASLNRRAAALSPQLAEDLSGSLQLVQQLTQEIRTASYLLHPPLLDDAGLGGALRWYVAGLAKRSGIAIKLELDATLGRLPRDLEAAVFHIVQESLTNIHRHSGSKTAMLRIARSDSRLCLEIEDEGGGIPADKLREIQTQGSGVGIAGMRERVLHFNGDMRITSLSTGTRIAVTFPVEPAAARAKSRSLNS